MADSGHFQQGGAAYAEFRPTYPPALAAHLAALAPGRSLAVDVGCGTGQLTHDLAQHFAAVLGIDPAPGQLAQAAPHPRIRYAEASADSLPCADASADLVTAAQAAHWFDMPAFNAEARRVLRPGGVVALITYAVPTLQATIAPAFARLRQAVAPFWPKGREHVENGYRDLPFPFAPLPAPQFEIAAIWSPAQLAGYVETWTGTRRARAGGHAAAIDAFAATLRSLPTNAALNIRFPVTCRAGRA